MSYLTSSDGTRLFQHRWEVPSSAARRGRVLLIHGYGEHLGRYEHVAQPIAGGGFLVGGIDLRGHGKSGGVRGFVRAFDDYLDDLELERRSLDGEGPLYIVAHSFGALTALKYCLRYPEVASGLALSSPYLKLKLDVPPPKLWAGRLFSRVWPTFAMPMGLKGTDVSHDPDEQRKFGSDPLSNKKATTRWFTETLAAQAEVLARAPELKVPCLLLHGGADPIADPARSSEVFSLLGSSDKTLEILEGQLHEIFNETPAERERTIAKVVAWLSSRSETSAESSKEPRNEALKRPSGAPRVA
jgi:alpha-beta hydrolase superfamily lysophospholipase